LLEGISYAILSTSGGQSRVKKTMQKITIIIVDDHPLFRQGVVDALSLEPDIDVIATASDGEEGLATIGKLKPQLAIVDINLPGMNGQQLVHRLIEEKSPTRVLLLTAYDDKVQKLQALRAGAAAYCTKDIQPEKLMQCIRLVAKGEYLIDGLHLDRVALHSYLDSKDDSSSRSGEPGQHFHPLSVREMDVLTCVTQGMSNKEIARKLNISQQTVKNHVTSLLRKIGVEDRTQAALYALRHGWVRLDQADRTSQE